MNHASCCLALRLPVFALFFLLSLPIGYTNPRFLNNGPTSPQTPIPGFRSTCLPTISIVGSPGSSVCVGTPVSFSATVENGGSSPVFQWKKNGNPVGSNSPTFSDATLKFGDRVRCELTSNDPCAAPAIVGSNEIILKFLTAIQPSVSLETPDGTTLCTGQLVHFQAVATNGGSSPSFQWKRNGQPVGSNSPTFSDDNFQDGDLLSVEMTPSFGCANPPQASASTTLAVAGSYPSSVQIFTQPATPICAGQSGFFTVLPTGGGSNPTFQWRKNGQPVGTSSVELQADDLQYFDRITCEMTSSVACAEPLVSVSNEVLLVPGQFNSSVSIDVPSGLPVCPNSTEIFVANPFLSGDAPVFQWKKNGLPVGFNSPVYEANSLQFGDEITVEMTSSSPCAVNGPAVSWPVQVTAYDPYITIYASENGVCSGTEITFTAYVERAGDAPVFQWKKNGLPVGSGGATYVDAALKTDDFITCELTSNDPCAQEKTVVSNGIWMSFYDVLSVWATNQAWPQSFVCDGGPTTVSVSGNNFGAVPSFQWFKNGQPGGPNSAVWEVPTVENGDLFTCEITSSLSCASPKTALSQGVVVSVAQTAWPWLAIRIENGFGGGLCGSGSRLFAVYDGANWGDYPFFQWKKNGVNVGYNEGIYEDHDLHVGDVIVCELTSSLGCAAMPSVLSNEIEMYQYEYTPGLWIGSSTEPLCPTETETFLADVWPNDVPFDFQWKINGQPVGDNSPTLTTSGLQFFDQITCEISSNHPCIAPGWFQPWNNISVVNNYPSVSIQTAQYEVCAGGEITFTATAENGGDAPVFEWFRNGVWLGVSANGPTFTETDVQPGDYFSCYLTSNSPCVLSPFASSGYFYPNVVASIEVNAGIVTSSEPHCPGDEIAFYAGGFGLGASPVYEWKVNDLPVGGNEPEFRSTGFQHNDRVRCEITSGHACAVPQPFISDEIWVNLPTDPLPWISIGSQSGLETCGPAFLVFQIDNISFGGMSPAWQWFKNGLPIGQPDDYTIWQLVEIGDVITCELISSYACAVPQMVVSNALEIVQKKSPPVVWINSGSWPVCPSTTEEFFVDGTFLPGDAPVFQWLKNGLPVGDGSQIYSDSDLHFGDEISCEMTSNSPCAGPVVAVSTSILVNGFLPKVSIVSAPDNVCIGTPITFSATPETDDYVGGSFVFQWKKNGSAVGSGGATFTDATLAPGDVITCEMTSNDPCANPTTVVSNAISPIIITDLPVEAFAALTQLNTNCIGEMAQFYAFGSYLGDSPTFQWLRNGVPVPGATEAGFSTSSSVDGDVYSCEITSSISCGSPKPAISNEIEMEVWTAVEPVVAIYSSEALAICGTDDRSFYVQWTTFGGYAPSFLWKKNGVNTAGGTSYLSNLEVEVGDVITCEMTSSLTCAEPQMVLSNALEIKQSLLPPSVEIASQTWPVCPGSTEVFYVSYSHLPGNSPSFKWFKNGIHVGNSTSWGADDLHFGDQIWCEMTSNSPCAEPLLATSNILSVNEYEAAVGIQASTDGVCFGTPITLTAIGWHEGNAPVFQWKNNGLPVGTNSPEYKFHAFAPGDKVTVEMISSDVCVVNPEVVSWPYEPTIYLSLPVEPSIIADQTTLYCPGGQVNFSAGAFHQGDNPGFQWLKNDEPIPGATQYFFSTTDISDGDIFECEITSSISCAKPKPAISNAIKMTVVQTVKPSFSIYTQQSLEICGPTERTFYTNDWVFTGNSPQFHWKKNGQPVGFVADYLTETVDVGDVITCEMTSSMSCAEPQTVAASNQLVIGQSVGYPSVWINSLTYPFCRETEETFFVDFNYTSAPGDSPVFQWFKNGLPVGDGSPTYTDSDMNYGDNIYCSMISSSPCLMPTEAFSNSLSVYLNTPSVWLVASAYDACAGTPITFEASGQNGGDAPVFQWKKNDLPVGDGPFYADAALVAGDHITVEMTTNDLCAQPDPVESGPFSPTIYTELPFEAGISTYDSTTICAGQSIQFYSGSNWPGSNPTVQWLKNGQPVGDNYYSFSASDFVEGDVISCEITSSFSCAVPQTAVSNSIEIHVPGMLLPSVSIASSTGGAACPGGGVQFGIDTRANAGFNPTFQWKKNGSNVGTYENWYDPSPATGDVVTCEMTSSLGCAFPKTVASNAIFELVHPVPAVPTVEPFTVCIDYSQPGQTVQITGGNPNPPGGWFSMPTVPWPWSAFFTPTYIGIGDFPVSYQYWDAATGCYSPESGTVNMEISNCGQPCQAVIYYSEPRCYPQQRLYLEALPGYDNPDYHFQWKKDGVVVLGAADSYQFEAFELGEYTVEITDPSGCVAESEAYHFTDFLPETPVSAPSIGPVCQNGVPLILSNGSPVGGTYHGYGVTRNRDGQYEFDPSVVAQGIVSIQYSGCSVSTTFEIEVVEPPAVIMEAIAAVCENEQPVALIGNDPVNGVFSGAGVQNDQFLPEIAGPGEHQISYSLANSSGCINQATQTVVVKPVPKLAVSPVLELCTISPPLVLTGGNPAGTQYSGAGVLGGVFDPATAGPGSHEIGYFFETSEGCTTESTQTVVVKLPVICPADRQIDLNPGCKMTVPNLLTEMQTNCLDGLTISQNPTAGLVIPKTNGQVQPVVVSIESTNFGSFTCPVVLTATDATPPKFTNCLTTHVTANLNSACKITIPNLAGFLKAADNCAGLSKTQSPPVGTQFLAVHGQAFPVVVTATDAAGNMTVCTRNVIAKDATTPVISTCPVARTVPLDVDCKLVVPNLAPEILATDACSLPLTTTQNPPAGAVLNSSPGMVHSITMTVRDAANNSKTCSVNLTGEACSLAMVGNDSNKMATEKTPVPTPREIIEDNAELAEKSIPLQTMPNPFNDELAIVFDLPETGKTRLVLMDLMGQFQFFETENEFAEGRQKVVWNTEDLPAGAYFVGLKTADSGWIWRKVVLVR